MKHAAARHRAAAYAVGTLTLALLVTFVTLDLQAMKREFPRPAPVVDSVYARGVAARVLSASE